MHSSVSKAIAKDRLSKLATALIQVLAGCSMAVPALCYAGLSSARKWGLFNPVAATLRSKYVPGHLQGETLNIIHLALNTVVVKGTHASNIFSPHVLTVASGRLMAAALIESTMILAPGK